MKKWMHKGDRLWRALRALAPFPSPPKAPHPLNWCVLQADNRPLKLFQESKPLTYDPGDDSVEMMHALNHGSLAHPWDYWSTSSLINRLKCRVMGCGYQSLAIRPKDHPKRNITWAKIRILLDFMGQHPEIDIVAFLDSDAFVRDERRFKALVEYLAGDPNKHGIFSRDPLMPKNTYINTGCMILKNNDDVRTFLETVWEDADRCPQYRWEWPHEQHAASDFIASHREAYFICRTAVLNTPCGEIVRHSWWKELCETLMLDELRATVARGFSEEKGASRMEGAFDITALLDI